MRRPLMLMLGAMLIWQVSASSGLASAWQTALPGAQKRGEATFRYLGFQLYTARLYTPGGAALDWSKDFGMELTYKRALSQNDLVQATLQEMRRQGAAVPRRGTFESCYTDVKPGDRYLAVTQGPDRVSFWRNDRKVCTVSSKGVKTGFMGIFLGDNTKSRRFTKALLGQ